MRVQLIMNDDNFRAALQDAVKDSFIRKITDEIVDVSVTLAESEIKTNIIAHVHNQINDLFNNIDTQKYVEQKVDSAINRIVENVLFKVSGDYLFVEEKIREKLTKEQEKINGKS